MLKSFFVFLCLFSVNIISSQSKLDKAISNLEKNYSQEKVYLLLDKDQYLNGDQIFFKTFVFDTYQPSTISTTLFVELYDCDKKLLDKKKVLLTRGEGNGSFTLDEKLDENTYYIRAYTPWMANFPEEFQTFQTVLVYNPDSPKRLELNSENSWTAKLYPESGTFIANTPTKFAVRLTYKGAANSDWNGYVINKEKPLEKLQTFSALDENVATFNLTPESRKHYQAIIKDAKGNTETVDLPAVSDSGVSLQVNSTKNGIDYKIVGRNLPENLKNYKVVGTIGNRLAYKAESKKPLGKFGATIPTNIYGGYNGVLMLTIFNENNLVMAQRLCFILPNDLNIKKPTITGLPLNHNPREANEFSISELKDFKKFTVLVKDGGENKPGSNLDENNLLSTLWLTGDFTDKIINPAQYFSNKNNSDALDDLLISEKWKRFDWQNLLSGVEPNIIYKPQNHISFKGRLAINSAPLANTSVNLLTQIGDGKSSISPAVTDSNGFIYLDNITSEEPIRISYFLNIDEKHKNSVPDNFTLNFQPLVDFVPLKGELPAAEYHLVDRKPNEVLPPDIEQIVDNKKNQQRIKNDETLIEAVQLKARKVDAKDKLNDELSTGRFSSTNAIIFDFINENQYATGMNILQFLQGRVAGLTFEYDEDNNLVPLIRGSKASIYLDESSVDVSLINSISVSEIAMVKIIKGNNPIVGNAIAIYFRKGNMRSVNDAKEPSKNNFATITAYDKVEEFSQPNVNSDSYKKITNDTRKILYWNPSLLQDAKTPAEVKFFNNDNAEKFKVTIISFSEEGAPLFYDEVLE